LSDAVQCTLGNCDYCILL